MMLDKTFCPFYKGCLVGDQCKMALTESVIKEAELNNKKLSKYKDWPECYVDVM